MSVWLTIPSARPAAEIAERIQRWQAQGYRIALWRNGPHVADPLPFLTNRDALKASPDYAGWGASINTLIQEIMLYDPSAEWFVGGGDDTDPDATKTANEIARQCSDEFRERHIEATGETFNIHPTLGVMQPTGDRWGAEEPWAKAMFPDAPAYIDRLCGSPWIGREFARRANRGAGPFWPEYKHMFADEELQEVAKRLGVLWQRPDLTHHHEHARRDGVSRTPDFATEIYSAPHWAASKALFESRKAAGFPGSELLA